MGYHRRHLSLFDYLIIGYVADRTVRRYGTFPTVLKGPPSHRGHRQIFRGKALARAQDVPHHLVSTQEREGAREVKTALLPALMIGGKTTSPKATRNAARRHIFSKARSERPMSRMPWCMRPGPSRP